MNIYLPMTGSGPIAISTLHRNVADPALLKELAKEVYGGHFQDVVNDLHEAENLRAAVIGERHETI